MFKPEEVLKQIVRKDGREIVNEHMIYCYIEEFCLGTGYPAYSGDYCATWVKSLPNEGLTEKSFYDGKVKIEYMPGKEYTLVRLYIHYTVTDDMIKKILEGEVKGEVKQGC